MGVVVGCERKARLNRDFDKMSVVGQDIILNFVTSMVVRFPATTAQIIPFVLPDKPPARIQRKGE